MIISADTEAIRAAAVKISELSDRLLTVKKRTSEIMLDGKISEQAEEICNEAGAISGNLADISAKLFDVCGIYYDLTGSFGIGRNEKQEEKS